MIPVSLHMVNFGPYEDSKINFNFRSALISGELSNAAEASNGTGKSTIFQAMTWVLTGSSRYKNSTRIIRHGADQTKVTLIFKAGDKTYRLTRGRSRNNKASLDFVLVQDDGKEEQVKADTNGQLDEKIAQVTKIRYDSFLNTVYFAQNSISEFMYGSSSVRQKLVAEILAMDRWNTHAKKADTHLKDTEKELDAVRIRLSSIGDIPDQISKLKEKITACVSELEYFQSAHASSKEEVERLVAQVASEAEAKKFTEIRRRLTADAQTLKNEQTTLEGKISKVSTKIEDLKQKILVEPVAPVGERPTKTPAIREKLANLVAVRDVLKQQLSAAENGECSSCGWVWDSAHQSHLEEKREKITEFGGRIDKGQKALAEAIQEEKNWDAAQAAYSRALNLQDNLKSQLTAEKSVFESMSFQFSASESRLKSVMEQLQGIPEDGFRDSSAELAEAKSELDMVSAKLSEQERKRVELEIALSTAEKNTVSFSQLTVARETLEKDFKIYSALARHFGKNGIQAHILENVVHDLETLSNRFLARLNHKPFSISFVTNRLDTKGQSKEVFDIEVISPEGRQSIEDISGGEQFRVAFSVRLALATIQARRLGGELQMLLLDEVSSSLDKRGLETFVSIIRELEKSMIVMVITHDDSLKEHFNDVIKVKNNGMTATIEQV